MSLPERERLARVALAGVPGIGAMRWRALLDCFGSADGALAAPFGVLVQLPALSRAAASAVAAAVVDDGARVVDAAARVGGRVLVAGDPDFPSLLAGLPDDPPLVLFARGDLALLARPAVAIVGSREHSAYGADVCRTIARQAGRAGVIVVSGMARGLDAVAHEAALETGTIGVLGNGLGVVYPAANRRLYEAVADRGLLLTEFPPGERPAAGSFPRRNRLISGLARATVVVEAAERSGTMVTVECALAQHREVLVVPGDLSRRTAQGTNRLLRDGANVYTEAADLLRFYPELPGAQAVLRGGAPSAEPAVPLEPLALAIAALLAHEPLHADEVVERIGAPTPAVLHALLALELAGVAERREGQRYARRLDSL